MKRKRLSKKEIRQLNKAIKDNYGLEEFVEKRDKAEVVDDKLITINEEPSFFYHEKQLIPTLKLIMKSDFLKKVVVDMPAVPFMVKGADVMRPGIKELDDFQKGELVAIVDTDKSKAKHLARKYKCSYSDNCQELLGNIDAVTISTPTICHLELAKLFIENGKAVLIEKPLAVNVDQAQQIVALAEKHNVTAAVGHS